MENLKKLVLDIQSVVDGGSLSPEYWLSKRQVEFLSDGILLSKLVEIKRQTSSKAESSWLVLDTGNADRGLLSLRGNESNERTSQKKLVPEGAVIVSRLRPYLKQVAFIPEGTAERFQKTAIYCSTEFFVLVAKDVHESAAYLAPWLLSEHVQAIFAQATTGGHHPRFDQELLGQLSVPYEWYERRQEISVTVESAVEQHLSSQLAMFKLVAQTSA